jgi:hypothetical protein
VMWGFIVMLKCIGEVHRFSAWRALGSILLIAAVVAVIFVAMILLFGGLGRLMHPAFSL